MEIMTSALTKPKLKSKVAARLSKTKTKTAKPKKAARAIPKAKANKKAVSGRKQRQNKNLKNQGKIKNAVGPKKETKSAEKKSHRIKPAAHQSIAPKIVKRTAPKKSFSLLNIKAKHKPHQILNKKQPVKPSMSETLTIPVLNEKISQESEPIQVSPNLSDKALHDYKLVRQAIDTGDQKAYAELMSRYKDSIYFMLLKMVNNRDDAEDLTIEAFGKAFKNIRQYTPDYAFSTWLFKIATNNCIDFIRKKRKQAFSIDRGFENDEGQEMVLEVKSLHPDPEEHFMKKQKVEMMRDVVDKLKPRYKKLVELRYFRELAYEEIAVELQLPLGTVKAQLFRAREFLYQIMKNSAHHI